MRAALNGTEIYFDIDGPELRIADGRLEKKPTLIALHGGPGFDHGYLRPGLGPLRDHAQVVYVDLRSQGRSGRPPLATFTLEQAADDVAALCKLLDIEHPIVFGHSAGGFVALNMAIRHPALVGGLILCDSAATLAPIEDGGPPAPTLASRAGSDVLDAAKRLSGGDISAESVKNFLDKVLPFYGGPSHMDVPPKIARLSSLNIEVMAYFFNTLGPLYDVRAALPSIKAPALVMVGKYDWVSPPRASRAIARGIPDAKLIEFANAGHFGFSEDPELFLNAVTTFINCLPNQ